VGVLKCHPPSLTPPKMRYYCLGERCPKSDAPGVFLYPFRLPSPPPNIRLLLFLFFFFVFLFFLISFVLFFFFFFLFSYFLIFFFLFFFFFSFLFFFFLFYFSTMEINTNDFLKDRAVGCGGAWGSGFVLPCGSREW